MPEREQVPSIISFKVFDKEDEVVVSYCPVGRGEIDLFWQSQQIKLQQERLDLSQSPGRAIGHRHGFRSLPEMNQILAQRRKREEEIDQIISVLDGKSKQPIRMIKDDKGEVRRFELA